MPAASFLCRSPAGGLLLTVPPEVYEDPDRARAQFRQAAWVLTALEQLAATPCRQLVVFNPDDGE